MNGIVLKIGIIFTIQSINSNNHEKISSTLNNFNIKLMQVPNDITVDDLNTFSGEIIETGTVIRFTKIAIILLVVFGMGITNILMALQLYFFKGKTIGKYILKIRVVKIDDSKISFFDALIRETLVKSILNSITGGLLNIGSLIMAFSTPEKTTVHDKIVKTIVVNG